MKNETRGWIAAILILLIYIYAAFSLITQSISAIPKIEPYVNDFANLLTEEQELNLNIYIDQIEKNTSWEIAIVTVQNTEGQDRLEYANKIGDENGVGKLDKDNGIVILYSLQDGGAIATGRNSESIFNDAKVGRIGRDNKKYFDNQKYYEGFTNIVVQLENEIKTKEVIVLDNQNKTEDNYFNSYIIPFIAITFILLMFLFFLKSKREVYPPSEPIIEDKKKRGRPKKDYSGAVPIIASTITMNNSNSSRSSSRSSGGGFSGGSFGGGSFGGGGGRF